jgi:hypothetical protein
MTDARLTRRQFLGAAAGAATATIAGVPLPAAAGGASPFPQLAKVVIADTHIRAARDGGGALHRTEQQFRRTIGEINAMAPRPAFVAHVGDIVSSPLPENFEAFKAVARTLEPLTVLTHGNHDGHEPWTGFRDTQRAVNGSDAVMLSFDCGLWHFLTFPCHFEPGGAFEAELLAWLRADLAANRGRPTVVFEHYHLLPQGLTQLETYTYDKPFRRTTRRGPRWRTARTRTRWPGGPRRTGTRPTATRAS